MTDTFTPLVPPSVHTNAFRQAEDEARARGYAAGYADGARRAEAELAQRRVELEAEFAANTRHLQARVDAQVRALTAATVAADARVTPVLEQAHDTLAAAALDLAEAVIGTELADSDTSAKSIIARTLTGADAKTVTVIRVSPDELPLLEETADQPNITFTADPTLNRGDAIASLPNGYLDARIHTALDRARTALGVTR